MGRFDRCKQRSKFSSISRFCFFFKIVYVQKTGFIELEKEDASNKKTVI